jgi:integrase
MSLLIRARVPVLALSRALRARLPPRVEVRESTDGRRSFKPTIRLHDLRHPCASLLPASGNSPRVVMKVLGHSGIAITMNTDAHVLPTLLGGAADGRDDVLG